MWLIVMRVGQGVGGAMLFANSTAILTDAFPASQRGMALGINQVSAIAGSFLGLIIGGLLSEWHWRAVFWVSVPIGILGTVWGYKSLVELGERRKAKLDVPGNLTFGLGLTALLVAITYGIQPYGDHSTGWTNPWVLGGLDRRRRPAGAVRRRREARRAPDGLDQPVPDPGVHRWATSPA